MWELFPLYLLFMHVLEFPRFSQTFIEGQPPNWANRLITITNKV